MLYMIQKIKNNWMQACLERNAAWIHFLTCHCKTCQKIKRFEDDVLDKEIVKKQQGHTFHPLI